jgi:hypothetical protein
MIEGADGFAVLGASARTIGVRPDIDVPLHHGHVREGEGGLSVSPDSPGNLPEHRRPPEHGGTGKDSVFALDIDDLPETLIYRDDPEDAGHGFIEPASEMTFDDFEAALRATRRSWAPV